MSAYREFKIQGILAALQSVLIVSGCMVTGVTLKVMGYPDRFTELPIQLLFVRNWGFLLLVIPLAWVILTIWLELKQGEWFTKRWTVGTGIGVLLGLGYYLLGAMGRASSSMIQSVV